VSARASRWEDVLSCVEDVFTAPSFLLFIELMGAWALVTARHTICQMVAVMDPAQRAAHDAYHRFVRAGAWSLEACFAAMGKVVVRLVAAERLVLYVDDTLFHRAGPKVDGAGTWRDAVRSSAKHVVYARGLNLVVLCVRVDPPWGGMPLALPIALRLYRKGGPTMPELAAEMMRDLAELLPESSFVLCADGAYATLAGMGLCRCDVVSRMRRDGAIYEPPPPKTGKRGRPRTRGKRLPTPKRLSARLKDADFNKARCEFRGKQTTKLIWCRQVLWYRVSPMAMVLLVVVRDPAGKEPDDFFFSTDLSMKGAEVLSIYGGRWAIEITNRDVKQVVGGQQPQSWKAAGPERAAGLSFWLYSSVWVWYLGVCGKRPRFKTTPWFASKTFPSFTDAMAELRRTLWRERISPASGGAPLNDQTVDVLVEALAVAA
jgi:hypothetical protein